MNYQYYDFEKRPMSLPCHRLTHILGRIAVPFDIFHNGIELDVVKLETDCLWWIIPTHMKDDDAFEDIGPFTDVDVAVAQAILMNDV